MKSIRLNLFTFFLVLVCISCQTNEGNDTNSSIQSPSYEPKPFPDLFTAMGLENKYGCTSLFFTSAERANCGTHLYEVTMTFQANGETCVWLEENGEDIGKTMTATEEVTFTFTEDGVVLDILDKLGRIFHSFL